MPSIGLGLGLSKSRPLPFTPHRISGLVLELDARNPANLTYDGANAISAWADTSGLANNAAQAVGASQPLFVSSGLNGYPVVRFDGSNDFLSVANHASLNFGAATDFSILAVAVFSGSAANYRTIVWKALNGGGFEGYYLRFDQTTGFLLIGIDGLGGTVEVPDATNHAGSAAKLYAGIVTRASATGQKLYVNNANVASGNPTTAGDIDNTNVLNVGIGRNGTSFPFAGDMAYVAIYNRALTLTERAAFYAWAKRNFAL